MTDMNELPIKAYVHKNTGVLELNRPKALNSVNHEMVEIIAASLKEWEQDDAITQVVLFSNSERAFCAGGDVRLAREEILAGMPEKTDAFFHDEYLMNGDIAEFSKPYVSLIDGVVMGGGLGISVHGSHRVISEKAFGAMPEMAIGYVPDVGVPYMLQQLTKPGAAVHALAKFIVLSGWHMQPADLLESGVATDFVPSEHMDAFREAILEDGLDAALARYSTSVDEPSKLMSYLPDIAATFCHDSWEEIDAAVAAHSNQEFVDLVRELTAKASPTALVAATELLTASESCKNIREELEIERRMGEVVRRQPDFVEGVRAVLVDKDRNPSFAPQPERLAWAQLAGNA